MDSALIVAIAIGALLVLVLVGFSISIVFAQRSAERKAREALSREAQAIAEKAERILHREAPRRAAILDYVERLLERRAGGKT